MNIKSVLLTAAALAFALPGCDGIGEDTESTRKVSGVINGEDIGYESWRGVVTVYALPTDTSCTGTLVAKDIVLTAGHCVYSKQYGIDFRSRPKDLVVWAGADVYDAATRVDYGKADSVQVHPGWDGKDHSSDLALLRLENSIEDPDVEIYDLRSEPPPEVGDAAVIVGYGRADDNDPESSGPQRMGRTAIRAIRVRPTLGKHSMIRLQSEALMCTGDSGGPVFTEQEGQWVITGVASMSDCFDDNANVNLLNHRQWLDTTITELSRFEASKDSGTDKAEGSTDAAPADTGDVGSDTIGADSVMEKGDIDRAGDPGCHLSPANSGNWLTLLKSLL